MRYLIYECDEETIPLEKEIDFIRNYIEIEQLRFGDRLDLRFETPADLSGHTVAPLLLLPFIENAFKHSLLRETEKARIHIGIHFQQENLCMKVSNSYHPEEQDDKLPGIGLANVRKRLELSYPGQYQLDIHPRHDVFEVNLKLSLHAKDPLRNSR